MIKVKKSYSLYLIKLVWKKAKSIYGYIIAQIIISTAQNVLGILFINSLITTLSENNINKAIWIAVLMCLSAFLLSQADSFIQRKKSLKSGMFNTEIKSMLVDSMINVSYEKYENYEFREKYDFALKCVSSGNIENIVNAISSFIIGISSITALISIISLIEWWLWIIIIVSAVINVICNAYRSKLNFENQEEMNDTDMKMVYSRDRLTWKSFAKEVRLFNMFDFVSEKVKKYIGELSAIQSRQARKTLKTQWWSFLFNGIQTFAVYIFVSYKCFVGEYSIAEYSVTILSILSISQLISGIAGSVLSIKDNSRYIMYFIDFIESAKREGGTLKAPEYDESTQIVFDDVAFKYEGRDDYALNNVNASFKKGKKYALVGANGSGKTTFTNLLMGLFTPTSGKITLGDIDVKDIDKASYAKLFSPVFQDFNIYAYTVAENISMDSETDNDAAIKLLKRLSFDKIDNDDMNKYVSKEYSDEGVEFSGGEMQKIAIARALNKAAPIVILDEPSSALSPQSEVLLYRMIDEILDNKTVFYISHRLASCILCDEILVFDNGNIVERGTHEELMNAGQLYCRMFNAQKSLYVE